MKSLFVLGDSISCFEGASPLGLPSSLRFTIFSPQAAKKLAEVRLPLRIAARFALARRFDIF